MGAVHTPDPPAGDAAGRHAAQLRGLAEAALTITSTLTLREVLRFVTEKARQIIGAHMAVTRTTSDADWAQAVDHVSLSDKYAAWQGFDARPDGSGIYRLVCEQNRPMRLTQRELEAHPAWQGFGVVAGRHPPLRGWLAAPLSGRDGRNIGVLQLSDKLEGEFTEDDEAILVQLAQMASVAVENARLYEQSERRRRAAEMLAEVGRAISQSLDPAEVGQRIVDRVCALLGAVAAVLYRFDADSGDLRGLAIAGQVGPDWPADIVLPRGMGVSGLAVLERRPVVTADALADPRIRSTPDMVRRSERAGYRAVLAVPLLVHDQVIGALAVGKAPGQGFDAEDVELAQAFADAAALALENSRLYAERTRAEVELRVRARQQAAIAELGQHALRATDLDAVMDEAMGLVAATLDVEYCKVLELQGDGTRLLLRAGRGWPEGSVGHATVGTGRDSQAGYTLLSDEPVVVEDLRTETRFSGPALLTEQGIVSGVSTVIGGRDRPFGVLGAHSRERRRFTEDDVRFLESVAGVLATAVARQRADEALRLHAERRDILHAIDGAILAARSAEEIATGALPRLRRLVPCARATVAVCDLDSHEGALIAVEPRGGSPRTGLRFSLDALGSLDRLRTGEPRLVPEPPREDAPERRHPVLLDGRVRSYVDIPLLAHGELIGALTLGAAAPGGFTAEEVANAREAAGSLAVALHNARLFVQVLAARERLSALSHRLVEVQEAERRHIARELHDEIGQVLTGLKLSVERLARAGDERTATELAEVRGLLDDLIARARELSLDLRPAMLDDFGLLPTLLWHFERYTTRTGIDIGFEHVGLERRLPSAVETGVYRIVQEALTNVARYAGVREVTVRVWTDDEALNVQVEDRGRGFAIGAVGAWSGLGGMRERAALLGGQLTVDSTPGAGTRVAAELPLAGSLGRPHERR